MKTFAVLVLVAAIGGQAHAQEESATARIVFLTVAGVYIPVIFNIASMDFEGKMPTDQDWGSIYIGTRPIFMAPREIEVPNGWCRLWMGPWYFGCRFDVMAEGDQQTWLLDPGNPFWYSVGAVGTVLGGSAAILGAVFLVESINNHGQYVIIPLDTWPSAILTGLGCAITTGGIMLLLKWHPRATRIK
jgi:hypothetical protein